MEHRTETHRVIWQGLFLPRRAKSLLGDTAMKVSGAVFRAADCLCLSRIGFGGDGLEVLGEPGCPNSVASGLMEGLWPESGQMVLRWVTVWLGPGGGLVRDPPRRA